MPKEILNKPATIPPTLAEEEELSLTGCAGAEVVGLIVFGDVGVDVVTGERVGDSVVGRTVGDSVVGRSVGNSVLGAIVGVSVLVLGLKEYKWTANQS